MAKAITDKIIQQLTDIRNDGKYNLFDSVAVQLEANKKDFHELVIFIEEHKKEYVNFLLTGERL